MFGLVHPNQLYTPHLNQPESGSTGREFSPRLWNHALYGAHGPDGSKGFFVGDDFLMFNGITPAIDATKDITMPITDALAETTETLPLGGLDGYQIWLDTATTASTLTRLTGIAGGVCRLTAGATDNHLAVMGTGILGAIGDTATGPDKLTIFEARVRLPTQVTDGSVFVGLGTTNMIADGGLVANDGDPIASNASAIGFNVNEANPDGFNFIVQDSANAAPTQVIADVQVAAADTWYKLGFVYNPANEDSKAITAYVDNVEQTTYVTKTNGAFASTFPDGDFLACILAAMAEGTTARLLDVDWWAFYQEV